MPSLYYIILLLNDFLQKRKGGERRTVVTLIDGHKCVSILKVVGKKKIRKYKSSWALKFLTVTLLTNHSFLLPPILNLLLLKFSQVFLEMLRQAKRDITVALVGSIKQT